MRHLGVLKNIVLSIDDVKNAIAGIEVDKWLVCESGGVKCILITQHLLLRNYMTMSFIYTKGTTADTSEQLVEEE